MSITRNADWLVAEIKNVLNFYADMHESLYIYERESRALTTGICVHAPRGGKGEVQTQASRRGAFLRNLRAQRCVAPARSPRHAGLPNSSTAIL
eukprot:22525-Pleurochrysis_carterae.AAC.1